jgi:hypothetical protein
MVVSFYANVLGVWLSKYKNKNHIMQCFYASKKVLVFSYLATGYVVPCPGSCLHEPIPILISPFTIHHSRTPQLHTPCQRHR